MPFYTIFQYRKILSTEYIYRIKSASIPMCKLLSLHTYINIYMYTYISYVDIRIHTYLHNLDIERAAYSGAAINIY